MDKVRELDAVLSDIARETGLEISREPFGGEQTALQAELAEGEVTLYVRGADEAAAQTARLVSYFLAGMEQPKDRESELRLILTGEGGEWRAVRYLSRYGVKDGPCYAIEIVPDRRAEEVREQLAGCVDEHDLVLALDGHIAVVRFSAAGEQDALEFGIFLDQFLYEELGVRASVGVGCLMKSFRDIGKSYAQAAAAIRMNGLLLGPGDVHSYREFLLVQLLEDIPKQQMREYLGLLHAGGAEEIFLNDIMRETGEVFLGCNLNAAEASRALFLHRNTLTYRLDRIKEVTGLDIRRFSDAVTFRLLDILYNLLYK